MNIKKVSGGTETLASPPMDAWMQEAVDGCADRDPTLPDRASDYCCYCWNRLAEIATLASKRLGLDGRVSEPGCD